MKNRFLVSRTSVLAIVGLSLAACGGSQPPPEAPAEPEPAAAEPAPAPEPEPPAPPPGPVVIKDVGFQTPESVQHDVATDTYLVTNINGSPLDKDDNGFISKLSPEGQVINLKWIDGAASKEVELNAPKGIGISNGKLYVADIDVIRTFDAETGKPGQVIKVAGSAFLNDVAVGPDGTVYVSDTGLKAGKDGELEPNKKDAIYKVSPQGKLSTLIKGEKLGLPNGLAADATGLWVATWQGALYHVSPDGKQDAPLKAPGAQLDGLVQTTDGQVVFSSWEKSAVFAGTPDTEFAPLLSDVKAPADIGYDSKRGQILVPLFTENTVEILKLPAVAASTETAPAAGATAEAKK